VTLAAFVKDSPGSPSV